METSKILIVEDEVILAMDLDVTLSLMGYTVCGVAISGESALKLAEQYRPDVILIDIKLNGKLNGIETAVMLKKKHNTQIIFLTAHADEKTKNKAKKINPAAFLQKPVKKHVLRQSIQEAL
jgi:DNA-binding NarL/FixJ family response regulator